MYFSVSDDFMKLKYLATKPDQPVEGHSIYFVCDEGCGNHACLVKKPEHVGTNGGCTCLSHLPVKLKLWVQRFLKETGHLVDSGEKFVRVI